MRLLNNEYKGIMVRIEEIIQKATLIGGVDKLSETEKAVLKELSLIAEAHEDSIPLMPIKSPQTLPDVLRYIMYQNNFKQKQLADELGISEALVSGLLNGKRKLSIEIAKKLHLQLGIEAHFLLTEA